MLDAKLFRLRCALLSKIKTRLRCSLRGSRGAADPYSWRSSFTPILRSSGFAERDPYVRNGLVTRWKVRGRNVVVSAPSSGTT